MMPRLMRDIKNLETGDIDEMGIYHHIDEKDIRNIKCMIIGHSNTPYEYGYYFFDMHIVDEYPFKPPTVTYQTRKNNIRFNPNLYCCGKVCLSIINTWSGPQWTSCQTPRSVMISLQTLLHENPLHNEPGYERCRDKKNTDYNDLIKHENYAFSIYHVVKYGLNGFECFSNEIRKHFIKNYEKICTNLETLDDQHKNTLIFSSIYNMTVENNYKKIKYNISELYRNMICDSPAMIQLQLDYKNHQMPVLKSNGQEKKQYNNTREQIKQEKQEKQEKQKKQEKQRKVPNTKPKKCEIGYKMVSENNGLEYEVSHNKANVKFWKKCK